MSSLKFAALHLHSRDIATLESFYVEVLGAEPVASGAMGFRVSLGGAEIVGSAHERVASASEDRFPHVTFEADLPDALALRERLSRCGVPTAVATAGPDGFVYFRDPAGYLWKLAARNAGPALRATMSCPDDEQVDVAALAYSGWTVPTSVDVP